MKKIWFAVLVAISGQSYAGTNLTDFTIDFINLGWGGEGVYIEVNETVTPVEGCSLDQFFLPSSTALFEENLSFLLSAYHTQTQVGFRVDGCYNNRMKLLAVNLQ